MSNGLLELLHHLTGLQLAQVTALPCSPAVAHLLRELRESCGALRALQLPQLHEQVVQGLCSHLARASADDGALRVAPRRLPRRS